MLPFQKANDKLNIRLEVSIQKATLMLLEKKNLPQYIYEVMNLYSEYVKDFFK
jgi:hypothetical protein